MGFRELREWPGVGDALVRSVLVIERFELAKGVPEVALVPDQGAVEQFLAAGAYPSLHDRVHPGDLDAASYDRGSRVGQDRVERCRVLAVPVTNHVPR
jgi:hypothetical protein